MGARLKRCSGLRIRNQRGSQFVEAGLALVVFFALVFLALDAGWGLFVKVTLQHAVAAGVRYGVTGQTSEGLGHVASMRAVVQSHAMGLLNGSRAATVQIRFYDPATLAPTARNLGGNILEISVENYPITPLAPLLRSGVPIGVTVRAADLIEPSPGGVPPEL
jgi:Flp pilus assembly protein TadG